LNGRLSPVARHSKPRTLRPGSAQPSGVVGPVGPIGGVVERDERIAFGRWDGGERGCRHQTSGHETAGHEVLTHVHCRGLSVGPPILAPRRARATAREPRA